MGAGRGGDLAEPGERSVKCLGLSSGRGSELVIYDIFGRPAPTPDIKRVPAFAGTCWTVDISNLPPGIYFVSVLEDGRRIAGGKAVVNR